MAGLKNIAAILDNKYSIYAQVVENVLREDLTLLIHRFFAEEKEKVHQIRK
jgi:ParB family chromosome partitioning protein